MGINLPSFNKTFINFKKNVNNKTIKNTPTFSTFIKNENFNPSPSKNFNRKFHKKILSTEESIP